MTSINIFRNATDFKTYPAGQTIFEAGQPGDFMYAVREGEVEILLHNKVIETVTEGGILGEMALIDRSPRSASAVAKTECQLVTVDEKRFTRMVQETPFFALQVMHVMADRIRRWGNQAE